MAASRPPPQARLVDFSPDVLSDRHDRQLSLLEATGCLPHPILRVLDLGSGSGVSSVWAARQGWDVTSVDLDPNLVEMFSTLLAELQEDLSISARVGDVCRLDEVPDEAFEVAYLKDLLEHVQDPEACLAACFRKLKPGGLIYVSTTNVLCPIQQEFHGVGPYSWYPGWLKSRILKMSLTTHPHFVNHTPYPALHWFRRSTLRRAFEDAGFERTWDIFDMIRQPSDLTRRTRLVYPLVRYARYLPAGRALIQFLLPGLTMVAQKPPDGLA